MNFRTESNSERVWIWWCGPGVLIGFLLCYFSCFFSLFHFLTSPLTVLSCLLSAWKYVSERTVLIALISNLEFHLYVINLPSIIDVHCESLQRLRTNNRKTGERLLRLRHASSFLVSQPHLSTRDAVSAASIFC